MAMPRPTVLVSLRLVDDHRQVGATGVELAPRPRNQPADVPDGLLTLVAPHRPVALFHPPANRPPCRIIRAIQPPAILVLPAAIERQPWPEVPAIQTEKP